MSVILFSKDDVYQELADAYERLKFLRYNRTQEKDDQFYKSLRRLYFANVATFLCQYHDDTPLADNELTQIDSFMELEGKNRFKSDLEALNAFLSAWGRLQYNLVTNDGEYYQAKEACKVIADLAEFFSSEVVRNLTTKNE
jgi:hypothetical protein